MNLENALPNVAPHIMPLWDSHKNIGVNPWTISKWSTAKYWWHCNTCGMSWEEKPINMHQAKGCYYCNGSRVISGKTDLVTLEPEIIKEWDYSRNLGTDPSTLSRSSNKKVWWKCLKEGHSWQAAIVDRTGRKRGCPYCSGKKAVSGKNDFATLNTALMREWDWEKNKALGIDPYKLTKNSHTEVWWKCPRGHSWKANPNKRIHNNLRCPYCRSGVSTSYPEQYIYWSLKQIYPQTINRYKTSNNVEYDIAVPEIKLLIEYNGANWHKDKTDRDLMKEKLATDNGLTFISICGDEEYKENLDIRENHIIFNPNSNLDEMLQRIIALILSLFHENTSDIEFELTKSLALKYSKGEVKYEDSLIAKYPHIAAEWDYDDNNGLTPADILPMSNLNIAWKCSLGHTWKTKVYNRVYHKSMCPICYAKYKSGETSKE